MNYHYRENLIKLGAEFTGENTFVYRGNEINAEDLGDEKIRQFIIDIEMHQINNAFSAIKESK